MGNDRRERLEAAIETILPIVNGLYEYEWCKIAHVISQAYERKAVKVQLDGSDLKRAEINLRMDLLDEPYVTAQKQSE